MKKVLPYLIVVFATLLFLLLPLNARAVSMFSDTFLGGYNDEWQSTTEYPPLPSTNGITGANQTTWSEITHYLDGNQSFQIDLDVIVNKEISNHNWGIGIGDNSGHQTRLNTWNSSIQIHDSSGRDSLINWDHSLGRHHFKIIISPLGNTDLIVNEDEKELYSLLTSANFDITKIWVSIQGNGDYELANFELSTYEPPPEPTLTPTPTQTPTPSPTPTLTPTPTPTSTPTPTPTPTNTPTPILTATPTPAKPKKVVVLHGMGGSWNKDALLNCKSSGYSGNWSPWKIANADVYQNLISSLQSEGFIPLPYYYDWRKTAPQTATQLHRFIQHNTDDNEHIDMVGHSFGGLVARAYLESLQTNSQLNNLLTVGSPHQGSVLAYPAWAGGEMWIDDTAIRLGFTIMKVGCSLRKGWSAREMIHNLVLSLQNVLPTFDYLRSPDGAAKPISTMKIKNNWLPTTFSSPYYGATVGTLSGVGYETLSALEVLPPNRTDQRLGNWRDGKPTSNRFYRDGDGTVLLESSQLPDATNLTLSLDHTSLVTSAQGINTIIDFLNGSASPQPLSRMKQNDLQIKPTKSATALLIIVDGARAVLTDKDRNKYEDAEGQITVLEPHPEAYTLTVIPEKKWWWKNTYKIVVVQLFEDGSSQWKEYNRHDIFKKHFKLRFDKKYRNDDILRNN